MLFRRPPAAFVDHEDLCVRHAVGERLQAQGGEPRRGLAGDDFSAAGAVIQVFDDHARIVERGAVFQEQHGHLAERILPSQRVGGIVGVRRLNANLAGEAEHACRKLHLAAER